MSHDLKDIALRVLIVIAGILAAVLLTMKGFGQALPAVAIGGALGAALASRMQQAASED
jgi:hypothetical protein